MGPYIAAGQPPSAAMRLSWHEEMPRLSQEPALAEAQPLVSEGEPELTAPVRDAPPAAVTAMRALHVLSSTTSRQLVSGIIICAASKWCGPLLRPVGFLFQSTLAFAWSGVTHGKFLAPVAYGGRRSRISRLQLKRLRRRHPDRNVCVCPPCPAG